MYIIKRDGKKQNIHFDKITERLKILIAKKPVLEIDVIPIVQKVISGVCQGITTVELDNLSADISALMATKNPDYEVLAARIAISNLHKETLDDYGQLCDMMYHHRHPKTNKDAPLLSLACYTMIKNNIDIIQSTLDYEKDYTYDYFGIKTLQKSYLLKIDGVIVERIQHMLMRVAVGINLKHTIHDVLKTYQMLSDKYYTMATPTLFNAGTTHPSLASCFLVQMQEDSVEGIYNTLKQCALISKGAGGIGISIHNVRAKNSYIKSTNGQSNGIVPMLHLFNDSARYIDQGGGKRKGSIAVYLEPHHPDIEEFLELKKNNGKEEMRCRDLFYAVWVSDLFMKRVEEDKNWSLFCPDECPGLSDVYGDDYVKLYTKYEEEGKSRKVVKAQTLWTQIMTSQIETGTPYLVYKDIVNEHNNQANLGTIKSSNLCCEIVQYSSRDEVATCNLASISLPKCINDNTFDHAILYQVAYQAIKDLNKVIDENYYPISETKNSNFKHRPVGLGVQGLADVFFMLKLPYDSVDAQKLNQDIFETLYYAAARSSCDLAKIDGYYESFPSSPTSKGLLCHDLWQHTPSLRWSYDHLRQDVIKYGLRNSLLIALMPTASTSNILGNNECIEPITSNIYTRRVLAGEFTMINKYLVKDLIKLNLWHDQLINTIVTKGGSIQGIDLIPSDLQLLYRTVWEIPLKNQIDMNANRQKFVDQAISFNVFMPNPTTTKLTSLHFYAWKKKLKTSSYYVRTKSAVDAIKFSVDKTQLTTDKSRFIEIYSKSYCQYCDMAKKLLDQYCIDFTVYNVDDSDDKYEEMIHRARPATIHTVPQIFINQKHIGGYQELVTWLKNNHIMINDDHEHDEPCLMCTS
ncbi:MAG TPA: ribonucleoside-diphosphate reductase subunit alpha [Candidatus Saccharimonadales bacterium]|nr:ribonucleoside-diphosphate reductase subunit alpha [Candidatus Saccharimonadales bacterium]